MTPPAPPASRTPSAGGALASMSAIVSAALLYQLAQGALQVYLPLHMLTDGFAPAWIGAVTSAYAAGFFIGCFSASHLVRRVGHVHAFVACAFLQAVFTASLLLTDQPLVWFFIRFMAGIVGAAVALVYESWINGGTAPHMRGRVFGLYQVLNRLSLIAGQLSVALLTAVGAVAAFLVLGLVFACSLMPVRLMTIAVPPPSATRPRFRALWQSAPAAVASAFHCGLVGGVLISILPVAARAQGLDIGKAALLAVAAQTGCLLSQWPLGVAADRSNSLRTIGRAASVSAAAALALLAWPVQGHFAVVFTLAAVLGASVLPTYALSLSHASQQQQRSPKAASAVDISTGLLISWSAGSIIGPVIATGAMQWFGPSALLAYMALPSALLGIYAWRRSNRSMPGLP